MRILRWSTTVNVNTSPWQRRESFVDPRMIRGQEERQGSGGHGRIMDHGNRDRGGQDPRNFNGFNEQNYPEENQAPMMLDSAPYNGPGGQRERRGSYSEKGSEGSGGWNQRPRSNTDGTRSMNSGSNYSDDHRNNGHGQGNVQQMNSNYGPPPPQNQQDHYGRDGQGQQQMNSNYGPPPPQDYYGPPQGGSPRGDPREGLSSGSGGWDNQSRRCSENQYD